MTREQFWAKFLEVKEGANKQIYERAEHILNSGAINWESWADDYILPRIVLASCLENEAQRLAPVGTTVRRQLANLRHF